MQNKLIVFVAVASVLIVAYFVYFVTRPRPCDGIFEQTAPQLQVKLGFIAANGAWAIGQEKVQEVAKESQSAALHLKTCCISREQNFIAPGQYNECLNGAKEYAAKIIQVTNIIGEAQKAKQQGNTEVAAQKAAEAKTAAGESTNAAGKLAEAAETARKQAEAAQKTSQVSGGKPYFFDFKGQTLGDQWEVIRPDKDSYALEKDGLLIINSKAGGLGDDNIPNLFRLKTAMPQGDWTATVKFSSEFLTANETFYLALFQDKENWTAATLAANPHWIWDASLPIGLWRKSANDMLNSGAPLFATSNGTSWNKFVSENTLGKPIYLRLQRVRHDFIASSRLETSEPDAWVTVNKIAELQASGNLVLGFAQSSQGTGQTQVKVEWVKIETP
jgi:hypothetical protein